MNENYEIDKLKMFLQTKKEYLFKNNMMSNEELQKIEMLEKLFNNDRCFFHIKFESAIGILRYLGINNNDLLNTYKRLIEPRLVRGNVKLK